MSAKWHDSCQEQVKSMKIKTGGKKKKREDLKVWAIIKLTRLFIWKHSKLLGDIMEYKSLNCQVQYIL